MGIFRKIINIRKETKKERKSIINKLLRVLEDERYFDTTYVFYDKGKFSLENTIKSICDNRGFYYERKVYSDGCIFYVYVEKMGEPKYNIGDVIQISDKETGMVTYRKRGQNNWLYTVTGRDDFIRESSLVRLNKLYIGE